MVKNEQNNLPLTLNKITGLDGVIMLDTGSTDNTIDITVQFCKKHKLDLRLKEEPFVDFATSRNVLLDFADKTMGDEQVYLLLLDSSDQLMDDSRLRKLCERFEKDSKSNAFNLYIKLENKDVFTTFINTKLIKSHCGFKYKGAVHEFITCNPKTFRDIVIYQDISREIGQSMKRFGRDLEILQKEYDMDSRNTRTVFYLAQTYGCLGDTANSYKYNMIRSKMGGFMEEVYESLLRAAIDVRKLEPDNWEKALDLFSRAAYSLPQERAEPLVRIAKYYIDRRQFSTAFSYLKKTCQLDFPSNAKLFVSDEVYTYTRWHLMGIAAYYSGSHDWKKWGLIATEKAIGTGIETDINSTNKMFYQ